MGGGKKGNTHSRFKEFDYDPVRGIIVRCGGRAWTRADPEILRRELVVQPGSQTDWMKNHIASPVFDSSASKELSWFYLAQIRHYGIEGCTTKQRQQAKELLTNAIKKAEGSLLRVPDWVLNIESDLPARLERREVEKQKRQEQQRKREEERKKRQEEERKRQEEELKRHTQSVYIISRKRKAEVMENINRRSKKSRKDELASDNTVPEEGTETLIRWFFGAERTYLFRKYPDSLGKYDIICPKMATHADRENVFELEVSPSSKGDILWGTFHYADAFRGRFRLEVTSTVSDMVSNSKPVVGAWQGKKPGYSGTLKGLENMFSITFLGDGRICGLMYWEKERLSDVREWEWKWKRHDEMSDSERDSDASDVDVDEDDLDYYHCCG